MNILLVCGSLRKESLNAQLMQIAKTILEPDHQVSILNYSQVPLFNQDLENPVLPAVKDCREAFEKADGVWFFTPEYNGQIPGVLKNLIDWMSRPVTPEAARTQTALFGRCAAVSGIGGNNMTKGSRELMEKVLRFCGMKVLQPSEGFKATPAEFKDSRLADVQAIEPVLKAEAEAFTALIEDTQAKKQK